MDRPHVGSPTPVRLIRTDHDDAGGAGVAIINEAMARRFWHNGDPLHDQLLMGRGIHVAFQQDPVRQIVGIVGDVRSNVTRPWDDTRPDAVPNHSRRWGCSNSGGLIDNLLGRVETTG
jgi:hypothetical protein